MARAAYSTSNIIILDDPLSAVDSHVGEHIFKNLICGFLADRTRILVTHQCALVIPHADKVIVLDGKNGILADCRPQDIPAAIDR
jgi:ATP-binding cassette subfamily C (CFTR/MRP) protein 1